MHRQLFALAWAWGLCAGAVTAVDGLMIVRHAAGRAAMASLGETWIDAAAQLAMVGLWTNGCLAALGLLLTIVGAFAATYPWIEKLLRTTRTRIAITTGLLIPAAYGLVSTLDEGRQVRAWLDSPLRLVSTVILLAGTAATVLTLSQQKLFPWLKQKPLRRVFAALAAIATALALDQSLLIGRYASLHALIVLASAWIVYLAFASAHPPDFIRHRAKQALCLGLAFALAVPMLWPWHYRGAMNYVLTNFAPYAGRAHLVLADLRWHWNRINRPHVDAPTHPARAPSLLADPFAQQSPAPHVLLLSIDGLSPWLAGMPDTSPTPAGTTMPFLAKRAQSGRYFPRAYATYPATEGSLLTILSGTWWHERGSAPLAAQAEVLLAFRARGYAIYCDWPFLSTILDKVKGHGLCDVEVHGWRREGKGCENPSLDDPGAACELIQEKISSATRLAWLHEFLRHESRPVLAWVHLLGTHPPYEGFANLSDTGDPYLNALRGTDAALQALWQLNQSLPRPALHIFFADHGHAFDWHGQSGHHSSLYEDQVRVPLIVDAPGLEPQTIHRPISLLELSGMLSHQRGGDRLSAEIFAQAPNPAALHLPIFSFFANQGAVIDGPFKMIADANVGSIALYNVEDDPLEQHSLVQSQAQRAASMMQKLQEARLFSFANPPE